MARGNGQGGRGISRGRGNVAQATVYQNSQQSVARGRGHGGAIWTTLPMIITWPGNMGNSC
ncbi:hypothetical protein Pyn_08010 [Prunus yedoensis var. nudiflora]|uniref:Uncharacterized protein n=1 Tax=Prunus yedoensis var. nudiflora TaxID=2094558 RepID=A0A314YEP6_PRUYE|nr:hypothetical protein Pyn_08010 [Prunus yedoensis var. nudiflora]